LPDQRADRVDLVALDRVIRYPVRAGKAASLTAMHDDHALAPTVLESGRLHEAAAGGRPVTGTDVDVL
jgi:hypothetical protein